MTPSNHPETRTDDPSLMIRGILIDEELRQLPYPAQIIERAGVPVKTIPKSARLHGQGPGRSGSYIHDLRRGKQDLYLTTNQGRFFKSCPATREYRCCDYQVLNIGMNCPMDCVYCILQAYLNNPWLSFFVNLDDLFKELDRELSSAPPEKFFRIGTGEFTDSMALDRITGLSRILVEYFADRPNAVLELKTKSAVIDNLIDAKHRGRTITAWSLNSPAIMAREELKTASLDQRLTAARRCAAEGYRLAFHFDPIIDHPGWREGYSDTIDRLFSAVPADQIAWISLGALRYLPQLKKIAGTRFPNSRFFHEEFVLGLDGKNRYFRSRRVEMYNHIHRQLKRRAAPGTCIYLCMESDEIWHEVFGYHPEERGGLPAMLDRAARLSDYR